MENNENKIQNLLNSQFGEGTLQPQPIERGKFFVRVEPGMHKDILRGLIANDDSTSLTAISGVDLGENIEILYHIRTLGTLFTVRTEVPKENPSIESIIDLLPGANFHEKEVTDFFGVQFTGNPLEGRFLLPEGWPKGNYPLRKDTEIPSVDQIIEEEVVEEEDVQVLSEGRSMNLILGPQHPALLEPEKFVIDIEGEVVKAVTPRLGYVHRGVEKACESRPYLQDVYLVERICGICNACHVTAFCTAVESILGTKVPPRANYLRSIVAELNRLHSHMLLYGHAGLEIGYESLFQYTWRDREAIMDLIEMVTGNRVNMSFITIGGVKRDITETQIPKIKKTLANLEERMSFYRDLFDNDPSLNARMKGVGTMSQEDAIKL